jgi:hypothetical protein
MGMFAEKYLKAGVVVGASLAILSSASQPAGAQMRLQTPRGDQTVAPSQMPQQPTLNEEFANPSKINRKVSPPVTGPDMPGMPGIEGPGNKPVQAPGMIQNGEDATNSNMKQQPTSGNGQPTVNTPRTGGMVLPQGLPTSVRIGPVEPVPVWQRAALALFLTLELVVLGLVGVALTLFKNRDVDEHDGHIINPDTTDARFAGRGGAVL